LIVIVIIVIEQQLSSFLLLFIKGFLIIKNPDQTARNTIKAIKVKDEDRNATSLPHQLNHVPDLHPLLLLPYCLASHHCLREQYLVGQPQQP